MKKKISFMMVIGFVILYIPVALYADDFFYGTFTTHGIRYYFEQLVWHYFQMNGRIPVHAMASLAISMPFLWKIVNIVALIALVYSILAISGIKKGTNNQVLIFALLMLIPIDITRETIFWAVGSWNYVIPFTLLLFCFRKIIGKETSAKSNIWMTFIFFILGWSTEQIGALSILMLSLYIIWGCFHNKKLDVFCLRLLLVTLIGYAILILAPGNFVRLSKQSDYVELTFIKKIITRSVTVIYTIILEGYFSVTHILISFLFILRIKSIIKNTMIKKLSYSVLVTFAISQLVLGICQLYTNKWIYISSTVKVPIILVSVITFIAFILIGIHIGIHYLMNKNSPIMLIFFSLSYVIQLIMIMAPYTPKRALFLSFPLMIVVIMILFKDVYGNGTYRIIHKFVLVLGTIAFISLTYGYYMNGIVIHRNIKAINEFKKNGQQGVLIINELKDYRYSNFEPGIFTADWIERHFKNYYGINEKVKIIVK